MADYQKKNKSIKQIAVVDGWGGTGIIRLRGDTNIGPLLPFPMANNSQGQPNSHVSTSGIKSLAIPFSPSNNQKVSHVYIRYLALIMS